MKVHPVKLPLFAYATLKTHERYSGTLAKFEPTSRKAFTFGTLHYVPYKDEKGKESVTVALDPEGTQRVEGELLMFNDSVMNRALAESDDKEFNFHDQSTRKKKDRVFIRTVITCYTLKGEAMLAWAYIYVPLDDAHKPTVRVCVDPEKYATVRYKKMSIAEYRELEEEVKVLARERRTSQV